MKKVLVTIIVGLCGLFLLRVTTLFTVPQAIRVWNMLFTESGSYGWHAILTELMRLISFVAIMGYPAYAAYASYFRLLSELIVKDAEVEASQ